MNEYSALYDNKVEHDFTVSKDDLTPENPLKTTWWGK